MSGYVGLVQACERRVYATPSAPVRRTPKQTTQYVVVKYASSLPLRPNSRNLLGSVQFFPFPESQTCATPSQPTCQPDTLINGSAQPGGSRQLQKEIPRRHCAHGPRGTESDAQRNSDWERVGIKVCFGLAEGVEA